MIVDLSPPAGGSVDLTPAVPLEVLLVPQGPAGPRGWSPQIAIANDGARRVMQVVDWQGGQGDQPGLGYVGVAGIVAGIGDAVDVRGPIGITGDKGWAPILTAATDGARRVLRVIDWTGGQGTKPASGLYIGASGLVADIADAVDVRGGTGAEGYDGWSPVLSAAVDGERRVLRVTDWAGGEGAEPASGLYIGATGLVADIADAVDVRGPAGPGTGNVIGPVSAIAGHLAVFVGTNGDEVADGGPVPVPGFAEVTTTISSPQSSVQWTVPAAAGEIVVTWRGLGHNSASVQLLQFQYSTDDASSWSSAFSISGNISAAGVVDGGLTIILTGGTMALMLNWSNNAAVSGSAAVTLNNRLFNTSSRITHIRIQSSGGSIDEGVIRKLVR